jgi:hypothetical protein
LTQKKGKEKPRRKRKSKEAEIKGAHKETQFVDPEKRKTS